MSQILEEATFETLALRSSRCGKFENIESPLLVAHTCTAPFGVELDSVYAPLPIFAGGADPRKHLTLQLEIPEAAAASLKRLDEACAAKSVATGEWSPLVAFKDSRCFVKVKLLVEGARPTSFRAGAGDMQQGWEHLAPLLAQHNNLRGASVKAALRPMYVWSVSGKRGISLGLEQIVVTPAPPRVTLDLFL
jgi:hypothetical protein